MKEGGVRNAEASQVGQRGQKENEPKPTSSSAAAAGKKPMGMCCGENQLAFFSSD
jgi:hypothetical protein